jgi:hypothetical protein
MAGSSQGCGQWAAAAGQVVQLVGQWAGSSSSSPRSSSSSAMRHQGVFGRVLPWCCRASAAGRGQAAWLVGHWASCGRGSSSNIVVLGAGEVWVSHCTSCGNVPGHTVLLEELSRRLRRGMSSRGCRRTSACSCKADQSCLLAVSALGNIVSHSHGHVTFRSRCM